MSKKAIAQFAQRRHKRAANALLYALLIGGEASRAYLCAALLLNLEDEERAALAYAALSALSDEQAALVAEVAA